MLITMPYLTIKQETKGTQQIIQGGREIRSQLTKAEVVVHQIKCPKMCMCLGPLPAPCLAVHPPAKSLKHQLASRRHPQEPGTPIIRYAKSRSQAEPAETVQLSPTLRSHNPWTAKRSCKALRSCEVQREALTC